MDLSHYTPEQIAALLPELEPELVAHIATLIAASDGGDQDAARKMLWAIRAYTEHPDQLVRYMARRVLRQEKGRLQ